MVEAAVLALLVEAAGTRDVLLESEGPHGATRWAIALPGEVPVGVVDFRSPTTGDHFFYLVEWACRDCGHWSGQSGVADIARMLAKLRRAPHCQDCARCRRRPCQGTDARRCCRATGRPGVEQPELPGMFHAADVDVGIALARSEARARWREIRDRAEHVRQIEALL